MKLQVEFKPNLFRKMGENEITSRVQAKPVQEMGANEIIRRVQSNPVQEDGGK
jgi:hypothetical protein